MTSTPLRDKILRSIRHLMMFAILQNRSNLEQELIDLCLIYVMISESRYLAPRIYDTISDPAFKPNYMNIFRPRKEKFFKQKIRMSWEGFSKAFAKFGGSAIFDKCPNPKVQFLTAFHRFGCDGNAASVGLIAEYFDVSGNVNRFNYSGYVFMSN